MAREYAFQQASYYYKIPLPLLKELVKDDDNLNLEKLLSTDGLEKLGRIERSKSYNKITRKNKTWLAAFVEVLYLDGYLNRIPGMDKKSVCNAFAQLKYDKTDLKRELMEGDIQPARREKLHEGIRLMITQALA